MSELANVLSNSVPDATRQLFAAAPPEFRLLTACCQWPLNEASQSRVALLLDGSTDWEKFLSLTTRHRVGGLVHAALAHQFEVPERVSIALARSAAHITQANLLSLSVLALTAKAFEQANMMFVVLKGLPLAELAFSKLSLRHSKDIDVLVSPSDIPQVRTILEELGFEQIGLSSDLSQSQSKLWERFRKHHEFVHLSSGVRLEVHWKMFDNALLNTPSFCALDQVRVGGGAGPLLPILPPEEMLLSLCVHGATHSWFRLKWIADVSAILSQDKEQTASRLLTLARSRGLDRPVEQALILCSVLFPNERVCFPGKPAKVSVWLTDIALKALLESTYPFSSATDFVPNGLKRSRLLLKRGWRYRIEEARIQLASPIDWKVLRVPRASNSFTHFFAFRFGYEDDGIRGDTHLCNSEQPALLISCHGQ